MSTNLSDTENGDHHWEMEWQLTSADLGAVHRWLAEHPTIKGLVVEHRPALQVHDTYFDTSDWRIQRTGFSLRVRNAAGTAEATLIALSTSKKGIAYRRVWTESLLDVAPETIARSAGPVGKRVQAVAGAHALHALFSVDTTRQRFAVRKKDVKEELGEINLDATVIERPDGEPQTNIQRVEVEAWTDESPLLARLAKKLATECSLESSTDSRFAVGLRTVGLAPPTAVPLAPDCVAPCSRVDEVAIVALRRQLSAWIAHEPGARLGEDPEELHYLRLAGHRMDATLAVFAPHLPATLVRMRARLKLILQALGSVRDLELQLAKLEAFECQLATADRTALQPVKQRLDAERARARTHMLRVLDSPQTEKWLARLKSEVLKPCIAQVRHDRGPIMAAAPLLIGCRYKKLRKAAARLSADSSMEEYHAVRGRIKKLRYAIESVAALYGKPADALLRSLRRLQEPLGEQQDAYVTLTHLQALARQGHLPMEAVFLTGRMAENCMAAGARGRRNFEERYTKLRKRWRRLRQRLDELNLQTPKPGEATSSADYVTDSIATIGPTA